MNGSHCLLDEFETVNWIMDLLLRPQLEYCDERVFLLSTQWVRSTSAKSKV